MSDSFKGFSATSISREAWTLKDGSLVTVRPIQSDDEPLLRAFHRTLSDNSVYFRYFAPLKLDQRISHERLSRVCLVDYACEVVLVVEYREPRTGKPEIVGIGRLNLLQNANEAELALLIGDRWQRKGIGTQLLKKLVRIGRDAKLGKIVAEILSDNRTMCHLVRKAGFDMHRFAESGGCEWRASQVLL